jgi:hypothetical protein
MAWWRRAQPSSRRPPGALEGPSSEDA